MYQYQQPYLCPFLDATYISLVRKISHRRILINRKCTINCKFIIKKKTGNSFVLWNAGWNYNVGSDGSTRGTGQDACWWDCIQHEHPETLSGTVGKWSWWLQGAGIYLLIYFNFMLCACVVVDTPSLPGTHLPVATFLELYTSSIAFIFPANGECRDGNRLCCSHLFEKNFGFFPFCFKYVHPLATKVSSKNFTETSYPSSVYLSQKLPVRHHWSTSWLAFTDLQVSLIWSYAPSLPSKLV